MNLAAIKEQLSSLQDIIYFDRNDYLREKTADPVQLKQFIVEIEQLLERDIVDTDELFFLYGTIGNLHRIYGQPQTAVYYLELGLDLAGDESKEIAANIRLGEALKYDHKHSEALAKFNEALAKCHEFGLDKYEDFALQHKGKCLLELGRSAEALGCFKKALELRKTKGDSSLIKSTQQAIELVNEW
ncbi:tetratricopeptide repeat protein [Natribacillus halophilus]|uniref:Tetratricopeptide repeat-containing protein n=1 Tax=Natribacillus halophilus TaxID=549003 RepID=A0A1G8PBF5_9BACI|nr:tetratricopeptide repeat protein [Natribacillus halophilus]SDI89727.1 Tetratricopeptide repeat-containing protein [Natribacillus halophilus]